MQNQESKMNRSVSGDKGLSRKEEIERFLSSHSIKAQLLDISVKEMRHYIPLFLMEVYSDTYGLYAKKVKGLWEKCPADWRLGVPFVDPNNKVKSEDGKNCKPKKEPLNQMLKYLIERYMEKQKNESFKVESVADFLSNSDLFQTQMSFNLVETDEASVRPSTSSLDQHSMYSYSGSHHSTYQSSASVFGSGNMSDIHSSFLNMEHENSFLEGIFDREEPINAPKQAVDNEYASIGEDWDPVAELKQRITQKLQFIKKQRLANLADFQLLEARYISLKEAVIDEVNCGYVIDDLHSLEKDIDKLRFSKRCSNDRFSEMPLDQTNQFSKKTSEEPKDETLFKCSDINVCTDPPVEVPVAVQDPSLMSSLNIKARVGGAQPSGAIGHLHLRSGLGPSSETQNAPSLKTSSLSEYCHPVQPTEDNLTGPSQNTMQTFELLFASLDNSLPFEDKMSELQLTDGNEENRIVKPVQETGVASYTAAPVADKVDTLADFGGASAPSLHAMCFSNSSIEFPSAVSLPLDIDMENLDPESQEIIRLLHEYFPTTSIPQPSTELAQPAMDTAQPPLFTAQPPIFTSQSPMVTAQPRPFSVGLQSQATYNKSQIKSSGKREYPFDGEDDDVEMVAAPNQSIPEPEAGYGSLIPTTVEEMSDLPNLPSSKNKKTRRTTWKDQA